MKVNINNLPEGYKIVNGKVIKTMALGGVPRTQANLEAEKGETALTDLDNDGVHELYTIGGERHHSGGTPLNLPEQSFIFSDTTKMKFDKTELAELGLESKKKQTPAWASKRFQLNDFITNQSEEHSDHITDKTSELMLEKNKLQLSKIAFMQEAKKDFLDEKGNVSVPLAAYPFLISKGINPEEFIAKLEEIKAAKDGVQQAPMQGQEERGQAMQQPAPQLQEFTGPPQGMSAQGPPPGPPQGGMPPQGMMPPQQIMAKYGGNLPQFQDAGETSQYFPMYGALNQEGYEGPTYKNAIGISLPKTDESGNPIMNENWSIPMSSDNMYQHELTGFHDPKMAYWMDQPNYDPNRTDANVNLRNEKNRRSMVGDQYMELEDKWYDEHGSIDGFYDEHGGYGSYIRENMPTNMSRYHQLLRGENYTDDFNTQVGPLKPDGTFKYGGNLQQGGQGGGGEMEQIVQSIGQAIEQGVQPQEVIVNLLQNQVPPEVIMQVFGQLGMPPEQAEQMIMAVMQQAQGGQQQMATQQGPPMGPPPGPGGPPQGGMPPMGRYGGSLPSYQITGEVGGHELSHTISPPVAPVPNSFPAQSVSPYGHELSHGRTTNTQFVNPFSVEPRSFLGNVGTRIGNVFRSSDKDIDPTRYILENSGEKTNMLLNSGRPSPPVPPVEPAPREFAYGGSLPCMDCGGDPFATHPLSKFVYGGNLPRFQGGNETNPPHGQPGHVHSDDEANLAHGTNGSGQCYIDENGNEICDQHEEATSLSTPFSDMTGSADFDSARGEWLNKYREQAGSGNYDRGRTDDEVYDNFYKTNAFLHEMDKHGLVMPAKQNIDGTDGSDCNGKPCNGTTFTDGTTLEQAAENYGYDLGEVIGTTKGGTKKYSNIEGFQGMYRAMGDLKTTGSDDAKKLFSNFSYNPEGGGWGSESAHRLGDMDVSAVDGILGTTTFGQRIGVKNKPGENKIIKKKGCENREQKMKDCTDKNAMASSSTESVTSWYWNDEECLCASKPGDAIIPPPTEMIPWLQDQNNLNNAIQTKFMREDFRPMKQKFDYHPVDYVSHDPLTNIHANNSLAATLANSPTATAAEKAMLMDKAAEGNRKAVNDVQVADVNSYNQFAQVNAQDAMNTDKLNMSATNQYVNLNNKVDQESLNTRITDNENINKQNNALWTNMANTYNANSLHPNFDIRPDQGGALAFKNAQAMRDELDNSSTDPLDVYQERYDKLKKTELYTHEQILEILGPMNSKKKKKKNNPPPPGYPTTARYGKETSERVRDLDRNRRALRRWILGIQ